MSSPRRVPSIAALEQLAAEKPLDPAGHQRVAQLDEAALNFTLK